MVLYFSDRNESNEYQKDRSSQKAKKRKYDGEGQSDEGKLVRKFVDINDEDETDKYKNAYLNEDDKDYILFDNSNEIDEFDGKSKQNRL